ncbi:proline-rich transmembrane protein 1-like [Crassostrea virginica]|uniref:Proline-rich transmembrane protein 1-like n=1 Tax=Crassostrea virginica TaxID=6565 RepID=A0A8B8AZS6_CRAVI|nr:proline-rich transmembrane protein 1-like [Crassostrea virginica]XP_022307414.1 proline-rich transmembrane protein 1-like [Crassostrea virginica]
MSEKKDFGNEPPPQYQPNQGYGQPPQYAPQPYSDHPGFPAGGYTTNTVLVAPGPVTMNEPPPPDYMTRAIFVTICCFWPTGIFAIMKASESRSAYARGDFQSARSNANSARQLSNISIMAGVASVLIGIIIVGVYVGLVLRSIH